MVRRKGVESDTAQPLGKNNVTEAQKLHIPDGKVFRFGGQSIGKSQYVPIIQPGEPVALLFIPWTFFFEIILVV